MVMGVPANDLRARDIVVALVSPPPTDTHMRRALIGPRDIFRAAIAGRIRSAGRRCVH
jgi:hypothetical protein